MTPLSTPSPVILLENATVAARLRARGAALGALPGEGEQAWRERTETALCALFRDERDGESFAELHRLGAPGLLRWIESLARGLRLDAGELLQDAFVNIYRYAAGFRDDAPRSFAVWSRTIAGNIVRRARLRKREASLDALAEARLEPRDHHAGPVEEALTEEERTRLAQAWMIVLSRWMEAYRQLTPREQHLMELVEVRGLSYAAVAEATRLGLSNVKMILFRARTKLRQRIGGELEVAAGLLRAG